MALELVNPGKGGSVHMRVRMQSYAHMLAPARARKQAETVLLFCSPVFGDAISWVDGEDILEWQRLGLDRESALHRSTYV